MWISNSKKHALCLYVIMIMYWLWWMILLNNIKPIKHRMQYNTIIYITGRQINRNESRTARQFTQTIAMTWLDQRPPNHQNPTSSFIVIMNHFCPMSCHCITFVYSQQNKVHTTINRYKNTVYEQKEQYWFIFCFE